MEGKRYMAPREAAAFLGIHTNTLRKWSDMGLVPAYRQGAGGHRKFKRKDLLDYLDRMCR